MAVAAAPPSITFFFFVSKSSLAASDRAIIFSDFCASAPLQPSAAGFSTAPINRFAAIGVSMEEE